MAHVTKLIRATKAQWWCAWLAFFHLAHARAYASCASTFVGGTSGVPYLTNFRYTSATRISVTSGFATLNDCYRARADNGAQYFTFEFIGSTPRCSGYSAVDATTGTVASGVYTGSLDASSPMTNIPFGTQQGFICSGSNSQPSWTYGAVPSAGMQTCDGTLWTGGGVSPPCVQCSPSCSPAGGTCVFSNGTGVCACAVGFTGQYCQTNIDECGSNPCANGGTCYDGIDRFGCVCVMGYSGPRCQTDTDECSSSPCANGGSCTADVINMFNCTCVVGYSGSLCETCSSCPLSSSALPNVPSSSAVELPSSSSAHLSSSSSSPSSGNSISSSAALVYFPSSSARGVVSSSSGVYPSSAAISSFSSAIDTTHPVPSSGGVVTASTSAPADNSSSPTSSSGAAQPRFSATAAARPRSCLSATSVIWSVLLFLF